MSKYRDYLSQEVAKNAVTHKSSAVAVSLFRVLWQIPLHRAGPVRLAALARSRQRVSSARTYQTPGMRTPRRRLIPSPPTYVLGQRGATLHAGTLSLRTQTLSCQARGGHQPTSARADSAFQMRFLSQTQ